jgi:putative membrane protein
MQKISLAISIGRILVLWISGVLGLLFITWLDPAISVDNIETAFIVVAVYGILNAVLWPILTRFTLPFLVVSFGAGLLLLNVFILWLVSELADGFTVSGWAYIITPIVMAAVTTIISSLLTIDDDASYFRSVLKKRIRQKKAL